MSGYEIPAEALEAARKALEPFVTTHERAGREMEGAEAEAVVRAFLDAMGAEREVAARERFACPRCQEVADHLPVRSRIVTRWVSPSPSGSLGGRG